MSLTNELPPFDITNLNQGLHVVSDGAGGVKLAWAADTGGTPAITGGAFDSSPAAGGGRAQVMRYSSDGTYANFGGDQGGSAHQPDLTTPLYKWICSNGQQTDINNDRNTHGLGQDPFVPNNWYKVSTSFWTSADKGLNWLKDTRTNTPVHSPTQLGGTGDPRVVDLYAVGARQAGVTGVTILAPDNNGVKRLNPGSGAWDNGGYTGGGLCICLIQKPNAPRSVWAIFAFSTGAGNWTSQLWKCTDFTTTGTTPTWTGPFTGGSHFAGVGFYPHRLRYSGTAVVLWCLNPAAVSANEATETGLFVLNADTNTLTASFQPIPGFSTVCPTRTTLTSPRINCFDVKTDGVNTRIVIGYAQSASPSLMQTTLIAGNLQTTSTPTWKAVSSTQVNLMNGQANTPWWGNAPGSNNAIWESLGCHSIDINPVNLNECLIGARQGPWRCPDLSVASPAVYPVHFGAGGATAFPGSTFDSQGCAYYGMSDVGLVPAPPLSGGPINPGVALQSAQTGVGEQSGSIMRHFSDDRVVMFARGAGTHITDNTGVWTHSPIANPLSTPSFAGQNSDGTNSAFVDQNFPHTAPFYCCGAVCKDGSGHDVELTAQTGVGWYLKINGVSQTITTPPPTPASYADVEHFADGSGRAVAYVDASGLWVTTDYGITWVQKFSATTPAVPAISSALRNLCGFVKFWPGDNNRVIAASDSAVYYCLNVFTGTPTIYAITGTVSRPGPLHLRGAPYNDMVIYQRQDATHVPSLYYAPLPVGTPPTTPTWTAFPDDNGIFAGQCAFCCKIAGDSQGNLICSSQGGGHIVWQVNG